MVAETIFPQDLVYEGSKYELAEQSAAGIAAVNFKDSLREVRERPVKVIDFNGVVAQAYEREDKTLSQSCIDIVEDISRNAPHTYMYTHDAEIARRLERLPHTFISRTSIAETSAHKVFFALLTSGDEGMRVAVKAFKQEPIKAIADWTNTMLARKSGLDTFLPLGLLISDGVGYTITERQDDIDPLDNVDWTRVLMQPNESKNMLDDLKMIGPALARLHHGGIFHGDPQMKNAMLTQRGSMHWIDWESSTLISRSAKPTEELKAMLHHKTVRDLRVLFRSLARPVSLQGVGLLHRQTPLAQWQHFDELILAPYFAERIRLLENGTAEQFETNFGVMEEAERDIAEYIKNGDLYNTLQRSRHTT